VNQWQNVQNAAQNWKKKDYALNAVAVQAAALVKAALAANKTKNAD
jgi:hypothetical protein